MPQGSLKTRLAGFWEGLTGHVAPARRLHPEFARYDGDGWYHNNAYHDVCCRYFHEQAQKISLFLNDSDLPRFNGCPYPAQLGLAPDPQRGHRYRAVLYAVRGHAGVDQVADWLSARGFERVSVLSPSRGYAGPSLRNA